MSSIAHLSENLESMIEQTEDDLVKDFKSHLVFHAYKASSEKAHEAWNPFTSYVQGPDGTTVEIMTRCYAPKNQED